MRGQANEEVNEKQEDKLGTKKSIEKSKSEESMLNEQYAKRIVLQAPSDDVPRIVRYAFPSGIHSQYLWQVTGCRF